MTSQDVKFDKQSRFVLPRAPLGLDLEESIKSISESQAVPEAMGATQPVEANQKPVEISNPTTQMTKLSW